MNTRNSVRKESTLQYNLRCFIQILLCSYFLVWHDWYFLVIKQKYKIKCSCAVIVKPLKWCCYNCITVLQSWLQLLIFVIIVKNSYRLYTKIKHSWVLWTLKFEFHIIFASHDFFLFFNDFKMWNLSWNHKSSKNTCQTWFGWWTKVWLYQFWLHSV